MRVTEMAAMSYSVYAFTQKHGVSRSGTSSSDLFTKVHNVNSYAKQLASGVSSGLTTPGNASSAGSTSSTSATSSAGGTSSAGSVSSTSSTSSASGTAPASTASAVRNTNITSSDSDSAWAKTVQTANQRKTILNNYASYIQSALSSSGIDMLA